MNANDRRLIKKITPALAIFLVAFLFRLIYLQEARNNDPYFYFPQADSQIYDVWAQEISRGDWLGGGVFWASPLYPYFLGVFYSVFGRNLYLARLVQMMLGSFSCVLIYFLAKRIFNPFTGLIAAFLAAGYGIFIFYDGVLLPDFLGILLNLLVVFFLFRVQQEEKRRAWLLVGVLAGLAALARPNILLFILLLPAWLAFLSRGCPGRVNPRNSFAFLLGAILAIAPVTLRNYAVGGDFVPISSQGGLNFYIGNNPGATGVYEPIAGVSNTPGRQIADAHLFAERTLGKNLRPSQVSSFWLGRAARFIRSDPGRWSWLLLRKFFLFWKREETTTQAHYYFRRRFSALLRLPLFSYATISPLAIGGIILARKNWRRAGLLYLFVFSYAATLTFFFIEARYRLPVVPFMMIFAAFTIHWGLEKMKQKDYRSLALTLGFLSLVSYFTNYPKVVYRSFAPGSYQLGCFYEEQGEKEKALVEYQKAVDEYQKTLEIDPDNYQARLHLGIIYFLSGKPEEALRHYNLVARARPEFADVYHHRGELYAAQEKYQEAISEFRRALEIEPDRAGTYVNLGNVYAIQGKYEEAISEYLTALELDPYHADCHHRLAMAYEAVGKLEEAKKYRKAASELGREIRKPEDLKQWKNIPPQKD